METTPLLATKFHRPAVQLLRVQRPQLVQRLNGGLSAGRALTLISAPAGFGKTCCAVEWLSQVERPVAWLSLDASDDDPVRFFAYFFAALQQVDETCGGQVNGVLQSGQLPPVETLTTILVNDLTHSAAPFVLVLDDFQVLQEPAILTFIERLISNLPSQLHLVMITREDPQLPLARLRANDRMTEVRSVDLRFTNAEVSAFFREVMPLPLTEQDIHTLEARTEGWAAGLQLAGLSLRGREDISAYVAGLSGSQRYILSYLTEEVLDRQPPEIRQFVLQTSILNGLTGGLCDAVTGQNGSAEMLERLFHANLFLIPLDDEQRWYRYHHLFADLLRSQLHRLPAAEVARLHQRASHWHEQAGDLGEAIRHALGAQDHPQAVRLLEGHAMRMLLQGYAKTLETWLQAIPTERIAQSARVNLDFAWIHLLRGTYAMIGPYLAQAESVIAREAASSANRQRFIAECGALKANLNNVQGKPQESIALATQALRDIPEYDHSLRCMAFLGLGGAYRLLGDYPRLSEAYQQAIQHSRLAGSTLVEMLAVSALTLTAIRYGELRFANDVGAQCLERFERPGAHLPPIAGTVVGVMGIVEYERNHLAEARRRFEQSAQLSALSGHNAGAVYTHVLMARIQQAEGDLAAASASIQAAVALLPQGAPAWLRPEVLLQQVRVSLAQDDPLPAEAALQQAGLLGESLPTHLDDLLALALLRYRCYEARQDGKPKAYDAARLLADTLLASAMMVQRNGIALQVLLLRAQLFDANGEHEHALADVLQAHALAEPEGYVRSFLDEGPAVARLLRKCAEQSQHRPAVLTSSAAFSQAATVRGEGGAALIETGQAGLVEPLTQREVEVLRLIAAGMKYEQVAENLVISLNTVRFHVKVIYSKLGVNNRVQAIEAARQRNLI